MVGCSDRRMASALAGTLGLAILSTIFTPPASALAQEPDEPAPEAQVEDPELRGLHARMLGLHEQMQEVRARIAERRRELLGEDAAQTPPHRGRHAMHLRNLGGGRDMGMGMEGMRGRGMMMGRRATGDDVGAQGMMGRRMMGRRMTGEPAADAPAGDRRMMRRGMMEHGTSGRGARQASDPRWCPSGMGRGMCRGTPRQGGGTPGRPGNEGSGAGG